MNPEAIYGVDFSAAKLAGQNTWIARIVAGTGQLQTSPYELTDLWRLEKLSKNPERDPALNHLVEMVLQTSHSLWSFDFPFGLPVELFAPDWKWPHQLAFVESWSDTAHDFGLECLRRAQEREGRNHIRRLTDLECKARFNPYHYRIIYQTFHGIRDVLGPLNTHRRTAVLPFHYKKIHSAEQCIVENCTGSTLRRLGLPHQNYKQPGGGPLTNKRRKTRRVILAGLSQHVRLTKTQHLIAMRNGGGDALDAIIAAVGAARSWTESDHVAIGRHQRYGREGRMYV
ncbi:MAG: DUF429 domain-containing protein [Gemmataceae bacterium]